MNTPFIDFKATEISPEKQGAYFVEPPNLKRIISQKASLIIGERGSGKTTLLRHLEKSFNESESLEYVGVYYRFETAYVKALNNPDLTVDKNIAAFSQSIVSIVGKLICDELEQIKKKRGIQYEYEAVVCKRMTSDIILDNIGEITTFFQLSDILECLRKRTLINLQNNKFKCYFDYATFLTKFCEELRNETIFKNTCFCILLDEYENLTKSEQRVINSFIKNSSYYLTYKVCMRPEGFLTKSTVAEKEQLMDAHDYETIYYVEDIVGTEKDRKKHLREVCANRLKYFYQQQEVLFEQEDLNIDNYLDQQSDEKAIESWGRIEEYKNLLKRDLMKVYPDYVDDIDKIDSAIDLKLLQILQNKGTKSEIIFSNVNTHSEKYKNWIHNYKQNIIYQIFEECEQKKKFCGFDTIIKLTNCNTRLLLEILHYAFGDYTMTGKVYKKINIQRQTDAINKVSNLAFDQIVFIPFNGYKAKNLANALGNIFQACLADKSANKFEVNSFSIRTSGFLNSEQIDELKDVLRDAEIWGVLKSAPANKIKNRGAIVFDGKDYILHPIFSPHFKISYSKRQKYEMNDNDVYAMFSPQKSKNINDMMKKIMDEYKQYEMEL